MASAAHTERETISLEEVVACPSCGRQWERRGRLPSGRPHPCPACPGAQLSRERVGCLVYLSDLAWSRWLLLADRLAELDPDYEVADYGFKWEYFYLHINSKSDQAVDLGRQFEQRVNRETDRANGHVAGS